jgi:hypothetical protein
MRVYVYSTIQHNEWSCPGALVAINENNEIVWIQQNPDNDLTRQYFDDKQIQFDVTAFKSVNLVNVYDE